MTKIKKTGNRAFNLLELVLVIVVLGILTAIAIPNYAKAKERALCKEAISNLKIVAAAEKIYHLEQGSYASCVNTNACNTALHLQLDNTNWQYTVLVMSGIYYAQADRRTGPYSDCKYTIRTNEDEPSCNGNCP